MHTEQCRPLTNVAKLAQVKLSTPTAHCSHAVNSVVTKVNLTKFLHDVQKRLPINLLKLKLLVC